MLSLHVTCWLNSPANYTLENSYDIACLIYHTPQLVRVYTLIKITLTQNCPYVSARGAIALS